MRAEVPPFKYTLDLDRSVVRSQRESNKYLCLFYVVIVIMTCEGSVPFHHPASLK